MTTLNPSFESVTCSRCGGVGRYSIGVCFKCHGRKQVLTSRGAAAVRYFRDLMSKPMSELAVGDKILIDGFNAGSYVEPTRWATVTEVLLDQPSNAMRLKDGVMVASPNVTIVRCGSHSLHMAPTTLVRVAQTQEQKAEKLLKALAYQDTLTKTGKPRKAA